MPNKPSVLPPEAETEIMELLFTNMHISSGDIAAILTKHKVYGDIDVLQDSYRKRLGQRLMASIRNENGRREVLATLSGEYVVVDCCSDLQKLRAIRQRIQDQISGHQGERVYDPVGVACTQTTSAGGMGGKTGLYLVDLCVGEPRRTNLARCLTARYGQTTLSNHPRERSGVLCGGRVRRLMPRECLRLQGFAEDQIDRLLAITSDAQTYKQAGNSVTVNVIEAIGQRLRAVDEELRRDAA